MTQDDTGLKELIPEFYASDPAFLLNTLRINLGLKGDKTAVDDVVLPPWARSPRHFLTVMRQALESEWVSASLHSWIDLIFGYKQRGEYAIASENGTFHVVFMPHNYEGGINLEQIADLEQRRANEIQAVEYGQCPKQLFKIPHPARAPELLHRRTASPTPRGHWAIEGFSLRTVRAVDEEAHKREVAALAVSESTVVSVGLDGGFCAFAAGPLKLTLDQKPLWTCAVSTDGTVALAGGYSAAIRLVAVSAGQDWTPRTWTHSEPISSSAYLDSRVCITQDLFVTGSWDKRIRLWDLRIASHAHEIEAHECRVTALTGQGFELVSADSDGKVVLTDLRMTAPLLSLYIGKVVLLHINPDSILAIQNADLTTIHKENFSIRKSPGRQLSTGSTDGQKVLSAWGLGLELWQADTGQCLEKIGRDVVAAWTVSALQVAPNGKDCYLGTDRGQVFAL